MHNALLINEVLGRIINSLREDATCRHPKGHVGANDLRKVSRRALTALSRSCRAFSEPALDAVWSRLDSLEPFLLCLPTRDGTTVDGTSPAFDDKEWSIVSRYTPRVRELKLIADYNLNALHKKVLQALWFRATTSLLPKLRKLIWYHKEIAPIRLFLGPSLVHLYVGIGNEDSDFTKGFLECYHILCPNLKSLSLEHVDGISKSTPNTTTAVSRAVSHRYPLNLQALSCKYIDEGALMHISNSRHLRGLIATLHKHESDNLRRLATAHCNPDHPPFENLHTLELRIQDLSSIIPFLRPQQQPFEEVFFTFDVVPTSVVLHDLFSALKSTTRRKTLRKVKLASSVKRIQGVTLHVVDFQALSPLMNFNLHTLDVDLTNPVRLTDDELAGLAQAWPDLEILRINRKKGWDHHFTGIPTLRGLLLVVQRCPKLRDLGLCVDARNVPSLPDDESLVCCIATTNLSLESSPIEESGVQDVAQFLHQHFPALDGVDSTGDNWNKWREVSQLIQETNSRSSTDESDSEFEFGIERIRVY